MKIINLIVVCLAFCLIFSACTSDTEEDRYTGILANDEVVSSIRQEIADKENSLLANNGDIFWTESGKLWHKSYECSYIANSKTILHGTIEEAKLSGKERACERCAPEPNGSIYDNIADNEYMQGDVFFTKEGNTWHTDINCKIIKGAQKIYFADIETAKFLGKECACEECEQ